MEIFISGRMVTVAWSCRCPNLTWLVTLLRNRKDWLSAGGFSAPA
jgi:hypothetical protein